MSFGSGPNSAVAPWRIILQIFTMLPGEEAKALCQAQAETQTRVDVGDLDVASAAFHNNKRVPATDEDDGESVQLQASYEDSKMDDVAVPPEPTFITQDPRIPKFADYADIRREGKSIDIVKCIARFKKTSEKNAGQAFARLDLNEQVNLYFWSLLRI